MSKTDNRYEARLNFKLRKTRRYCDAHTTNVPELLQQLQRETYLKTLAPQMISGALQGQFLRLISQMIRPQKVLEIGTFTGYATHCLAAGLTNEGTITTVEVNDELAYLIKKYLELAGLTENVKLIFGDANEIIPGLTDSYDLIFMDAAKRDYSRQYDMLIELLNPNGVLLADNVLWSGKVLEDKRKLDAEAIHQFNQKVMQDHRTENVLLPLRDGLMMVRRKEQ